MQRSPNGLVARGAPRHARYLNYLQVLICSLSIVTLGLGAYTDTRVPEKYYSEFDVLFFLMAVAHWSFFVYSVMFAVASHGFNYYSRVGAFTGQLLSICLWTWAWIRAATWAAYALSFDNYSSPERIRGHWKAYGQNMAACAGIGSLISLSCIAALILFYMAHCSSSSLAHIGEFELADASKQSVPQDQSRPPGESTSLLYKS
ncbi:hypothetical protein F5Y07DRAFT_51207 [Xylaria sp. FL0933]|nr:hypothetical protein F5Y07DRAFT_51207 [Xylaria sp. FL0933]